MAEAESGFLAPRTARPAAGAGVGAGAGVRWRPARRRGLNAGGRSRGRRRPGAAQALVGGRWLRPPPTPRARSRRRAAAAFSSSSWRRVRPWAPAPRGRGAAGRAGAFVWARRARPSRLCVSAGVCGSSVSAAHPPLRKLGAAAEASRRPGRPASRGAGGRRPEPGPGPAPATAGRARAPGRPCGRSAPRRGGGGAGAGPARGRLGSQFKKLWALRHRGVRAPAPRSRCRRLTLCFWAGGGGLPVRPAARVGAAALPRVGTVAFLGRIPQPT